MVHQLLQGGPTGGRRCPGNRPELAGYVRTYVVGGRIYVRTYLGTYLQRTCVRNVVAGLGSHAHALFSSAPIRGIRLDTYIFAAPVEYLRTSVASGRRTDPTCTDPTLEIVRLRQCALAASCFTNVSTYW